MGKQCITSFNVRG